MIPIRLTRPVTMIQADPPDIGEEVLRAIIDFYAGQPSVGKLSPIWDGMRRDVFGEIIQHLESGDLAALKHYLDNIYPQGKSWGLDYYGQATAAGYWVTEFSNAARSIGCAAFDNPEQPDNRCYDPDALLQEMERGVGRIHCCPIGGRVMGGVIGDRFIPPKYFEAIRLVALLPTIPKGARILEIGAGLGFVAIAFNENNKTCSYHIVDLPYVSAIQMYMFACRFPKNQSNIHVHGLRFPEGLFDLVINQNSFPEIPKLVALEYLRRIENCLSPGGVFVSVNHESGVSGQSRVFDMVRESTKLKQTSRFPWIGREGYVWETFEKG